MFTASVKPFQYKGFEVEIQHNKDGYDYRIPEITGDYPGRLGVYDKEDNAIKWAKKRIDNYLSD